ncbi:hypothetical protein IQ238_20440 [Pleurocapsales cyanobacterium LEGE 06147]|nr:hypothetical protein [Pleurocapsales cyanobacterium LEGE 06147]
MMENWKFLLQKKGDRFWQELKTQSVEIEEGKYRLLGQSSYLHFPVEIYLNYQVQSTLPCQDESCLDFVKGEQALSYSLKHYRKTNVRGLIEISPFFYFHPGVWELSCRGDVFSEMLGESWQEKLQLKVTRNRETELYKTTKQIDLFYPRQSKIKCQRSIALVGQILPPKICAPPTGGSLRDRAQTPIVIKLPSI